MFLSLQFIYYSYTLLFFGPAEAIKPEHKVYIINQSYSSIQATSRYYYTFMRGRFRQFSGHFRFSPENPKQFKLFLKIRTDSFETGLVSRDKTLQQKAFFDSKKYPYITFQSMSVPVAKGKQIAFYGLLTIKKKTWPLFVQMTYNGSGIDRNGKYRIGLRLKSWIDRGAFGFHSKRPTLGDQVFLAIELSGDKKGGNSTSQPSLPSKKTTN